MGPDKHKQGVLSFYKLINRLNKQNFKVFAVFNFYLLQIVVFDDFQNR